jgi:hypothetical protein
LNVDLRTIAVTFAEFVATMIAFVRGEGISAS